MLQGDQKCLVRETKQFEVASVRAVQKVSYAETVGKVEVDGQSMREHERIPVSISIYYHKPMLALRTHSTSYIGP